MAPISVMAPTARGFPSRSRVVVMESEDMRAPWQRQVGGAERSKAAGGAPQAQAPQQGQPPQAQAVQGQPPPQQTTMEATVASREGTPSRRKPRWTLEQLRQTDGIIPLQYGTNKYDSQKGMIGFGTIRNTELRIRSTALQEVPEEIARLADLEVRGQAGSNKFDSQKGYTSFGAGRDVCREGRKVKQNPADIQALPEEKERLTEGIVRLQSGTNRFDSQKGMTGIGTNRREITKMKDSKHPEYQCDMPDQGAIPLQMGTNKFASQKGMTGMGTNRRELTKMVDTKHPDYNHEINVDSTTIPSQMGSNKFASQKLMTSFGQGRWECLNPLISMQVQKGQGIVPSQYGSNQFASQSLYAGFGSLPGTPRNNTMYPEGMDLTYEDMKKSEMIIRSQAGWNRGDSQKGYTSFGAPRDVKGKHMKRIWELEYPEAAEAPQLNDL